MNFIYENGPLAKIVAFLIGSTIMCVVVLIVWCHRKNQLRRKRNKQETIKLRRELARNKLARVSTAQKSRLIINLLKERDTKRRSGKNSKYNQKFDLQRITAYADSIQQPSVSSSVESVVSTNIHLLAVNGAQSMVAQSMVNMSTANLNKVLMDQNRTIREIKQSAKARKGSFRLERKGSFLFERKGSFLRSPFI